MNALALLNVDQPETIVVKQEEDLYEICKGKGLKGQLKRLKSFYFIEKKRLSLALLAKALARKNMMLLEIGRTAQRGPFPIDFSLARINEFGNRKTSWDTWRRKSLKNFKGNIPDKIIKDMPPEIVGRAEVFYKISTDPIIAVKIKQKSLFRRYYVGIYQWD